MHPCQRYSHPKMTRRNFLKVFGVTAAGAVLASCKSNPTEKAVEPSQSLPEAAAPQTANGEKPVVAITKANSYDRKLIRNQVQDLLDNLGGVDDVLAHGTRVAIKVNLTGGTSVTPLPGIPEIESYLTHPEIVRALIELLRDAGAKDLYVVEAVYEKQSWTNYGYRDMAKETGAILVDLTDADPYPSFMDVNAGDNPLIYEKFKFNPILTEIDALVSVSKLKCHNSAGVTHTMKNLYGLVPYRFYTLNNGDRYRSAFHGTAKEIKQRLPRVIVDLNQARPVNLGIVDGIWTTEAGEGPWIPALTPIKSNIMIAGKNPVATDAVATAAMGFDPTAEYPNEPFVNAENHLNIAASAGLGTNRLDQIKVVGASLEDVTKAYTPSY